MDVIASRWMACTLALALAACGGGGSGNGSSQSPPSSLQYPVPPAYVVKQAIQPLTPTVVGQVTRYFIAPPLTSGLSMDPTTGVISGTPSALAPKTTYTITAGNEWGNATASVAITVNDVTPAVGYPSPRYEFTANVASQKIVPSSTGGSVTGWSVSPVLPAGIALNATDGSISGTPTTAAADATYTVTATNSGGQATYPLTIGVTTAPLLDLGYTGNIWRVMLTSSRVLVLDNLGQSASWALQDFTSTKILARADIGLYDALDLEGNTMIDRSSGGLEVRSATDGTILATLTQQNSWWKLASDGTYIAAGSSTTLTAWTPQGQVLFSRTGDYSKAKVFAAPGEVRVAGGPAGGNVIETISTATGTATVSPAFNGAFSSWFIDGEHFLTSSQATVWTYSKAAVQADVTSVSSTKGLAGQGGWFWNCNNQQLSLYRVGASSSPVLTTHCADVLSGPPVYASGLTLGIVDNLANVNQIELIDLSVTNPTPVTYTGKPFESLNAFAATSASQWIVGNGAGALLDGPTISSGNPRYLSMGNVYGIAGGAGHFSVSTGSGKIMVFNSSTNVLEGTIASAPARLAASADGTVLAAALFGSAYFQQINIYSIPAGSQVASLPYLNGIYPTLMDMSLSGSGTVLGETLNDGSCHAQVIPATGGSPIWCENGSMFEHVRLSPDGSLSATAMTRDITVLTQVPSTDIYKNGTLVTTVTGWALGWLDNQHLLVNDYNSVPEKFGFTMNYAGTGTIYDATGNRVSTVPLPVERDSFQTLSDAQGYAPALNIVFLPGTGPGTGTTWASANSTQGIGAVAGAQVVFASGSYVLAQPH